MKLEKPEKPTALQMTILLLKTHFKWILLLFLVDASLIIIMMMIIIQHYLKGRCFRHFIVVLKQVVEYAVCTYAFPESKLQIKQDNINKEKIS